MDYAEYVRGVSFRLCQPHSDPSGFNGLQWRLRRFPVPLEVLNTRLPAGGLRTRRRLRGLYHFPRMSTFAVGAMINEGVRRMPAGQCFVNVGVWCGYTLLAGMVGNAEKACIGVDNFSEFGAPRRRFFAGFNQRKSPNHRFYEMDYADYFGSVHEGPIGFYIYDGSHDYENQLRGLRVAEPFFAKGCVVMVDDTNWDAPRQATLDFVAGSSYGYQVLLDETTYANVHPTLWNGLMILRRVE
ncbi:MAG: class I SAM-dependent methyltransferase [Acidobacteriota bacterium]|nr:class I SAM-dependent methyltransferase [Acidobacteriota bacterium]